MTTALPSRDGSDPEILDENDHGTGGIRYVEASTDNEIDALFSTPAYRSRWADVVKESESADGLKAISFYSGYSTYRTTGWRTGMTRAGTN